eukprot:4169956-Amphidinium_carterae.1
MRVQGRLRIQCSPLRIGYDRRLPGVASELDLFIWHLICERLHWTSKVLDPSGGIGSDSRNVVTCAQSLTANCSCSEA